MMLRNRSPRASLPPGASASSVACEDLPNASFSIRSVMAWHTSFAMGVTASGGVKGSPRLLVEAPDEFLKDGRNAVVVEAGVPNGAVAVQTPDRDPAPSVT